MANIRLRYVKAYVDRHGRARHYFRKPGCKPVALPGLPGSDEFMAAYGAALADTPRVEIGERRTRAGSIGAMIVGYLATADFAALAAASQQAYRRIFERMRTDYGDLPIATLERRHVLRMRDAKAATPIAARDFLRCLRLLIHHAIALGIREDDPTAMVKVRLKKSDGIRTFTEEEIATFEAAYPVGTKPRLALALLLGTAARRSDVVKLGRGHVRDGMLYLRQQKTGKALAIPVMAELAEAINAAAPADAVVFLLNENGRAFTAEGFTKWFAKQCQRAGLDKGLSPHGLRKASCRRLAEAGCSAHEIASISGHAT